MSIYSGPAWLLINATGSLGGFSDCTTYMVAATGTLPSFQQMLLQRGTADIPLRVLAGDTYAPQRGQQVLLLDQTVTQGSGQLIVFAGKIQRIELTWDGSAGDRLYHCSCVSLEACLDEVRVPPVPPASFGQASWGFAGVSCGQIVATLFNALMGGSPISLPSGTGPLYGLSAGSIVASLDFSTWPRLSEIISQLATLSEFISGVNPQTQALYFCLPNTTPAPFSLATSQMQWESMKWETNLQDYRNRQILQIQAAAFAQSSELFAAIGYAPLYFNLLRAPSAITFAWVTLSTRNSALGTFFGGIPSPGDTITISYPLSGSYYTWQANFPYQQGASIIDPAGHTQIVVVGNGVALSGSTPPAWNDAGGITTDLAIVWQDQGVQAGGVYEFVTVLDNTQWGQVLIGASVAATIQNLVDAINGNQSVAGATFSWPTWPNPLVEAAVASGTQISVVNQPAGAGFIAALAKSCANFVWSAAATGITGTTKTTAALSVAINGQSDTANLYYTPGQTQIALASLPSPYSFPLAQYIQVQYTRDGGDCIVCEATGQIAAMKLIDHGTGEYQQFSSDLNQPSNAAGLAECQAELAAYGGLTAVPAIPIQFTFDTLVAGLIPGSYLTISLDSTAPAYMATLVNGNYAVLEVRGELVPTGGEGTTINAPGAGHFRYTITVINAAQIGTWLDFWQGLASGGLAGGGGAGLIANLGALLNSSVPSGAPNVVSAVAAVNYVLIGNTYYWYLTGTITLPSSPAFIASIVIDIVGVDATACVLNAPSAGFGSTITFQTPNYAMPLASETLTVEFNVINSDGVATASPFSLAVTVTPATFSNLVIAEVGPRTIESTTSISVLPYLSNSNGVQYLTFWYSYNGGSSIYYYGVFPYYLGVTGAIDLTYTLRTITQAGGLTSNNFIVYATVGAQPGNSSTSTTYGALSALYPSIETSNAITVLPAAPLSTVATAAVTNMEGFAPTVANIYMGSNSLEQPYWTILINLQTAGPSDPNTFCYNVGVQAVNSAGTPISPGGLTTAPGWQFFAGDVENDGGLWQGKLEGSYANPGIDAYLQISIWGANLNTADDSSGGLPYPPFTGNSGEVLQACWPGSATLFTVHIGQPPATLTGTGLSNQISLANPNGAPTQTNSNTGTSLLPDWQFAYDALGALALNGTGQWDFIGGTGSVTIKNDGSSSTAGVANYAALVGNAVIQQYTAGVAGQALYFAFSARSNNPGGANVVNLAVTAYNSQGVIVNVNGNATNLFSVTGPVSAWEITANSGTLLFPANVSEILIEIYTPSGVSSSLEWDVTNIIVQPVRNQSSNGQTNSQVPQAQSGGYSTVAAQSASTVQASTYGLSYMQLIGTASEEFAAYIVAGLEAYMTLCGPGGASVGGEAAFNCSSSAASLILASAFASGGGFVSFVAPASGTTSMEIAAPGGGHFVVINCGSGGTSIIVDGHTGFTGAVAGRSAINGIVI